MKKTFTLIALTLTFVASALELKIVECFFTTTAAKPNQEGYIGLDWVDRQRNSTELIVISMHHKNADGTLTDSLVLRSFYISEFNTDNFQIKNNAYRIPITMPDYYIHGSMVIKVTYTKQVSGGFFVSPAVGVEDDIVNNLKSATYYSLDGQLLPEPKGICIEVIGNKRSVIYKEK
jgi:hypothetical protein